MLKNVKTNQNIQPSVREQLRRTAPGAPALAGSWPARRCRRRGRRSPADAGAGAPPFRRRLPSRRQGFTPNRGAKGLHRQVGIRLGAQKGQQLLLVGDLPYIYIYIYIYLYINELPRAGEERACTACAQSFHAIHFIARCSTSDNAQHT